MNMTVISRKRLFLTLAERRDRCHLAVAIQDEESTINLEIRTQITMRFIAKMFVHMLGLIVLFASDLTVLDVLPKCQFFETKPLNSFQITSVSSRHPRLCFLRSPDPSSPFYWSII